MLAEAQHYVATVVTRHESPRAARQRHRGIPRHQGHGVERMQLGGRGDDEQTAPVEQLGVTRWVVKAQPAAARRARRRDEAQPIAMHVNDAVVVVR